MNLIPATVLSGFAGSGKSTLSRRLIAALSDKKVAVIVSDLGPGDVDAGLCESKTTDGSIRCESREHFALELRKLGRARAWDHLIVESTGISEPLPVAEMFAVDDGRGTPVSRYTKIDTMITVIDATRFLADLASPDRLVDRGIGAKPTDQRRVAEVLVAQVELADLLCLTKADLVAETELARIEALLRKLNPRARVVRAPEGDGPVAEMTATGLFDYDASRKATSPARMCELPPAPAEHGFASFGYRRFRPFHPARFEALVHGDWAGVVRSKGTYWVADRPDTAGEWSQAGSSLHHAIAGSFWAVTPEADWPVSDEQKLRIKAVWQDPYGDRRQELSFVVDGLSRETLEARLDACLLTDAEFALGPEGWRTLGGHEHGAHDHGGHAHDHGAHDHAHDHGAHDHEHAHDHGAHDHGDAGDGHDHSHDHARFQGHSPAGGRHSP
ncbi:MAG: GTP-binding protein [Polyangiaceae bacterium]